MNLRSFILIISLLLLAVSCTDNPAETDPDPDPDPVNPGISVSLNTLPDSYRWDEPVEKRVRFSHEDGFSEGYVRFLFTDGNGDSEIVWEIDVANRSEPVDTTWSYQPFASDAPLSSSGIASLEYELTDAFSGVQETVSGSQDISVLSSRFTEGSVSVADIFSGDPVSEGYVTFTGFRSIPISEGVAFFSREQEIDADSLARGRYMVLVESPGYVERGVRLSADEGGLESLTLIRQGEESSDGSNWSYNTYLEHLYEDRHTGNVRSNRWADVDEEGNQLVVDVLLYDQSYIAPCEEITGPCRVSSSDPNLIASDDYIENSITAYKRIDEVIPNITLNFIRESESEEPFPKELKTTGNVIDIAGSPYVNFAISRNHFTNSDGTLSRARAFQRTDPPATNVSVAAALADGIENMSLSTTGQESLTVNLNTREITSFGLDALHVLYSRDPHSGSYNVSLDRSDGTVTSTVRDYTPPGS